MKPTIVWEKRSITTDEATYYCSLCGEQLFILGGFFDKPAWNRPLYLRYVGFFFPYLIGLLEKTKNAIKEWHFGKLTYVVIVGILSLFGLILLFK